MVSRINPRISANTRQRLRLRGMLAGLQRRGTQTLEQVERSGDEDRASRTRALTRTRERRAGIGLGLDVREAGRTRSRGELLGGQRAGVTGVPASRGHEGIQS